jgi:hypothetical protein
MAIDYNFNDPALQGLLGAAGPIMDTSRQAAVMPMTQEAVAPDYLSMLAGLDLSGLGGFGGGRMGGVIQDPNIEYITAPISNKGNPTGKMGGNVFSVTPDQPVRLVDLNTKTVIFEGTGADAAREATRLGQSITDEKGRKASYDIQTADPSGTYVTVANEKRNKSTLGKIGDVVGTLAPIATAIATAGMSLPAQMALAAGAGGLGAALKGDNILKGAALGGATAGIAGGTGLDKAIGGVLGNVGKGVTQSAAQSAGGDIVVTALSKALQGAGSAIGQEALSQAGKAGLSEITGYKTPAEQFAQQPLPQAFRPLVDIYAGIDPINVLAGRSYLSPEALAAVMAGGVLPAATAGNVGAGSNVVDGADANDGYVDPETGDIVVSKYRPINPPGGFDPIAFVAATGLPIGSILESLGALNPPPADPALMQPETLPEDIVVSGRLPTTTPSPIPGFATAIPAVIPGALTAAQTSSTPPGNGGVLGTGLNIPQLLSIGGVGADLLKSLLAGGDGTGTGVPYVSPFGTGVGFAPGQDMRADPNILDYERYGFGPEAMFFRPEYSGLLPANAAPAQAPQAMTINPAYMPLI